jgi:large repetitive protein
MTARRLGRFIALVVAASLLATLAPLGAPGRVAAAALPAPNLTYPSSGASITGNPVFAWEAVSGAAKYTISVSTASDYSSSVSGFPVTTFTRNYAPPAELPNGHLYWRVAAVDAAGATGTNATDEFTKGWGDGPNATSPAQDAVLTFPTDPLLFAWDPLPGAQAYELEIDDADDFIGAKSYDTKNTSYTVVEPLTTGQAWYWRVRGVSGSVFSDWSEPLAFTSTWPTKPVLVYPAADATGITDVYFDWDPVLGAKTYQLQVSPNVDFQNNITIDETVKSTRYDPPTPLNNGNYYWRVRAIDAASAENYGPWSDDPNAAGDERVFQRGWPDKPTILWPPDGGSTTDANPADPTWQNPTFSWTPAAHASWYRVRFATNAAMTIGLDGCITNRTTWTPYTSVTGVSVSNPGSCSVSFDEGTTYFWDVAALDDPVLNSGVDIWGPPTQASSVIGLRSTVRSFVWSPPASVGTPVALESGDYLTPDICEPGTCTDYEGDTPTFAWTAAPGAFRYLVTVSLDPNFTNVYRQYCTAYNRLAPRDSWRDNQANQAYYWNVTPIADTVCGVTPDLHYVSAFQKRTLAIERLSPAGGSEQANDFTMTWRDYLATNQDRSPAVGQEATEYKVTTSAVADFSSVIEAVTVNTPFHTPSAKTYPEGPVYWKVQAIDGSGNLLTQSTSGLVTKKSPVPTQTFPANGATQQGVPYLQWNPLAYAASYDVQLDTDPNFSSPIKTQTTKMSAWAYTDALGAGTYYWRVRRNDADSRDGAWSSTWSFHLTPAAPILVAPANTANPGASTLLMQWSVTRPFAKYTLDLSTSNTFSNSVSGYPQTTVMTSWAPKTLLANGGYYWRVRGLNSSGTTVATSDTWSFTIGVPPIQENGAGTRETWARWSTSKASGGALKYARRAGASIAFTFTGTSVKLVGTKNTSGGYGSVYLDGVLQTGSLKFYSSKTRWKRSLWSKSGLANIQHTLTIVAKGTKPKASKGSYVYVDAFVVGAVTTQENGAGVVDHFRHVATGSASAGAYDVIDYVAAKGRSGPSYTVSFTGTGITWYGTKTSSSGKANVYVDGVKKASVDLYKSSTGYMASIWSSASLANGNHTLRIVLTGTKRSSSKGYDVSFDYFVVR